MAVVAVEQSSCPTLLVALVVSVAVVPVTHQVLSVVVPLARLILVAVAVDLAVQTTMVVQVVAVVQV